MQDKNSTNGTTSQESCPECKGQGYTVEHWPSDDGGPDYVLRPTCLTCQGDGESPAILTRDHAGRARRIRVDGHEVQLNRLDHSDLLLLSCYNGDTGEACEVNRAGICAHALEGLFTAARDAGACVTTCPRQDAAEELAEQVGGRVILARSEQTPHGEGMLWLVAGSNGRPAPEASYEARSAKIIGDMLIGEISPALAQIRLAEAVGAEGATDKHYPPELRKFSDPGPMPGSEV